MTDTLVHYHVEDGVGRPAINVKVYAPNHLFWPAGLTSDEQAHEDIIAAAHDRITSDFWQAAEEIATQRGLGEIEQQGRSGGWLVFTDGRDPQDPETFGVGNPSDDGDESDVREWLAEYRAMVEWAEAFIADAPRKVADLAQQYAMDEAGFDAASRMFSFGAGIPDATWAYEGGAPRVAFGKGATA